MQNSSGTMIRNVIVAVLLVVLGGVIGYRMRGDQGKTGAYPSDQTKGIRLTATTQPSEFKDVEFEQFWTVWSVLEDKYLDSSKLDKEKMVNGAISGMTAAIGDPYTVYLPPVDQQRSKETLSGAFFGIGIELGYIENVLAVTTPLKDSPAERAGLKAKDLILHVKDEKKGVDKDTQGWALSEAVNVIRGERGTSVTLTILRQGENREPFQVTIQRDEIVVKSAEVKYLDYKGKKYAHIVLSRFGERTLSELNSIIMDIERQSPKVDGIILDMRNNPGGFLEAAIRVASEFIKKGNVATQKGKYVSQDYPVSGTARLSEYPLIVLVNGGSASASEIVAGALRDHRNAKLVGEKTFGKGTVQDALELEGGAGLHVTIARWLLPKGDWIHDTGIPVTVEVKDDSNTETDEQLERAKEELGR